MQPDAMNAKMQSSFPKRLRLRFDSATEKIMQSPFNRATPGWSGEHQAQPEHLRRRDAKNRNIAVSQQS
jgi:hypothetical protein